MVFTPPDPMPPDYKPGVAIQFVFDYYVPCQPTSDSVLNSLAVRGGLLNELLLSRPNTNGDGKYERGGFVFRRSDGTYYLQYRDDGVHKDCKVTDPPPAGQCDRASWGDSRWLLAHPSNQAGRAHELCRLPILRARPDRGGRSIQEWGWQRR
jgi:hypothetical protein